MAWPVVLEQALFTLVILADVYIVSRLGTTALTGVGLAGQVLLVPTAVVSAVGVGTTALVARQTGAGAWSGAADLAAQAMLLAVGLGGVCAIILAVWAKPILSLSGAAPAVVTEGALWLRVAAPAFVLRSLMSAGGAALRGSGDMRTPMVIHVSVALLNLGVAWSLTQGMFGLPRLGVLGNALGTATEQAVGGLAVLAVYLLPRARLRLRLNRFRLQPTHLRHILRVGLPAGAEQIFFQAALAALLGLIGQLGTEAFTAHQVVLRLSFLASLPGWGFSVAVTTLVGQALGRQRLDQAQQYAYLGGWLGLLTMGGLGVALWVWNLPLLRLFTSEAAILAQGEAALRLAVLMLPLMAASFSFSGALYGAGDTGALFAISLTGTGAVRLLIAVLFGLWLGWGLIGVWVGIAADYACRAALAWGWLQLRHWKRLAA